MYNSTERKNSLDNKKGVKANQVVFSNQKIAASSRAK
jgi:hypothetical protein